MKQKCGYYFYRQETEGEAIEDVHSMLARHLNRNHIEIHIACEMCINGEKTPTRTYRMFEAITDIAYPPHKLWPNYSFGIVITK